MKRLCAALMLFAARGFLVPSALAKEYVASLSAAQENPANGSIATGLADLSLVGDSLTVNVSWSGLTGPATAAHIHCCIVPPTNTIVAIPFVGFPNAASGSYLHTFDLTNSSSYAGPFLALYPNVAAAEADVVAALNHNVNPGQTPIFKGAYVNIHTSANGGGEIRGFPTPEPGTLMLALLAAVGIGFAAHRRRP